MAKRKWGYMAFMANVSVIALCLLGCATTNILSSNDVSPNIPSWAQGSNGMNSNDYTVLGSVMYEDGWFGILNISVSSILSKVGFAIPFTGEIQNSYLIQYGGTTYADLLKEA